MTTYNQTRTRRPCSEQAWRWDDDPFHSRVSAGHRLRRAGEGTGRFDDEGGANVLPRDRDGFALGEHIGRASIYVNRRFVVSDSP